MKQRGSGCVQSLSRLLRQVGDEAFSDPDLHQLLLDPPTVMGVESNEMDRFTIRLVARTLPGKQFEAGRALRMRITRKLLIEGIVVPNEPHPDGQPEPFRGAA